MDPRPGLGLGLRAGFSLGPELKEVVFIPVPVPAVVPVVVSVVVVVVV